MEKSALILETRGESDLLSPERSVANQNSKINTKRLLLFLLGLTALAAAFGLGFMFLLASKSTTDENPCKEGEIYMRFLGQSVIQWDYRETNASTFADFAALLKAGFPDVVFTDLELAINGTYGGESSRGPNSDVLHAAGPWVLELLQGYGVNLLANANNHAYDLKEGGILSTIEEMEKRSIAYSGIGKNIYEAITPAYLTTSQGVKIAMVAVASAPTLDTLGGKANETTLGVNAMQLNTSSRELFPSAYQLNSEAIASAANVSDIAISYHHNHYFEPIPGTNETDEMYISDWWRDWAHHVIDQGASIYVSHGSTKLHGLEIYKNRPILYGLGSLVFQTRKANGSYDSSTWESVVADTCFTRQGVPTSMRFIPFIMNDMGAGTLDSDFFKATRGLPTLARNDRGLSILKAFQALSDAEMVIDEQKVEARVTFPQEPDIGEELQAEPHLIATNDIDGERND